jgi:hypothetical protein
MKHTSRTKVSRRASVARTFTSFTVGCTGDVAQGEQTVYFNNFLKQYIAKVNLYGRSCSGVAPTEAEAIAQAKAVCEELRAAL